MPARRRLTVMLQGDKREPRTGFIQTLPAEGPPRTGWRILQEKRRAPREPSGSVPASLQEKQLVFQEGNEVGLGDGHGSPPRNTPGYCFPFWPQTPLRRVTTLTRACDKDETSADNKPAP